MIGDNIKKFRQSSNMIQKDLADKLFVTAQAVSRWENGEVEPSITTLTDMAKIFNVSVDELVGNAVKEPEVRVETKYVYNEPVKPVLGVCEVCNKPIYESSNIYRWTTGRQQTGHVSCKECQKKKEEMLKQQKIAKSISRRKKSFWIGGLISGGWIAITIATAISNKDASVILPNVGLAIVAFTYLSCLILGNNFIGEMTLSIFSWGFVRMPGVIFTLDLDGLIWLLTVKLLFWILGIILALICGAFAILLGLVLSVFTYPFAIIKNFKRPEEIDLI
ncbi:MAG: helix-turn-helix transcriptional regulator [Bacilli bacterium]|jgi:transcriptional regulator with XRE-family HTH domain